MKDGLGLLPHDGDLLYDGEWSKIEAGDVVLFHPRKTHEAFNRSSAPLVVFSVWWSSPEAAG